MMRNPAEAERPAPNQEILVRKAARALARTGLVRPFGHCSLRLDAKRFLVCAAKPMGLIRPGESGTVVHVDRPVPPGVLGEVRVHQQIYRRRADVGAVCRVLPEAVIALSVCGLTPQARNVAGSYFAPAPPLWDNPLLLRDDESAAGVADLLGDAAAVVMRGNGAVVVGSKLQIAVGLCWMLEEAARIELATRSMQAPAFVLRPEECAKLAVVEGRIFERLWEYLTDPDEEQEIDTATTPPAC